MIAGLPAAGIQLQDSIREKRTALPLVTKSDYTKVLYNELEREGGGSGLGKESRNY